MNILAEELNAALEGTAAGRLLSKLGRRLYFPRGIIAQGAEAKKRASFANATIGMAFQNGEPFHLSAIKDNLPTLSASESVVYAPTCGVEALRVAWQAKLLQKNPSILLDTISLPAVVPGITAGISLAADLFAEEGESFIVCEPCWDNYSLIFAERRGAVIHSIPFFADNAVFSTKKDALSLNLEAFRKEVLEEAKKGVVRLILNFPNNPSGYAPTRSEAAFLLDTIREAAEGGADVLVFCDDAYFGLFFEDEVYPQSFFARLSSLHERVLAVKLDGPIKEEYVWGFRIAFVTFGSKGLGREHFDALSVKLAGAVRSSVSCANTASQYLLLKLNDDSRTSGEKDRYDGILCGRYKTVRKFLENAPPSKALMPLPFNSGYFMCWRTACDAEVLRKALLSSYGIGLVSLGSRYLRLAFSSLDEEKIPEVCRAVYECAEKLYTGE